MPDLTPNGPKPGPSEYVRFRIGDAGTAGRRLAALEDIVRALRERKSRERGGQLADDDADEAAREIAALMPREAVATFDPSPGADAWLPAGGLVVRDWALDATLWGIFVCEYDLGEIVRLDAGTAELRFCANAWPFGGVTSLVRLVEAFGFGLTEVDNGTDVLTPEAFAED